ncbi:MAG: hypothetical protein A2Z21_09695 [Candidatus Fraserbacteria bacterium RBG_16_55_9]|uniref:DUF58 domain-containing protein n=1 Tax=Fraserbacteria sp. (strain RBG_16_55_9) TaxID=1817864 RepID=A0A1F5UR49_FRAXR|nr:MAG: hypothetical protein A2Z21_09695 [Candidatus Fraserbacteria bacterium RBG_16_55_9]
MTMKRTNGWRLVMGLALALIILGLALRQGTFIALALPFLITLAVGIYTSPNPQNVRLNAQRWLSREQAQGSEEISVTLAVLNAGERLDQVQLVDRAPSGLKLVRGEPYRSGPLAAGETLRWEYTASAERGLFTFSNVHASVTDWLGLTCLELDLPALGRLAVLPGYEKLEEISIRPRRTRVYAGTVKARESGAGVEFFGTRQYQPGDELRWINWKASARREASAQAQLITNAFEQERAADVGIVLDARQASYVQDGDRALFEAAVRAAASLARLLLRLGNRVALLTYGDFLAWAVPGYGKLQEQKILESLTPVSLGNSAVFAELDNLPVRLFPRGSQIVIVSPLLEEDVPFLKHLRAQGYQVLLISPDPINYEMKRLDRRVAAVELAERIARLERETVLTQLRRAGIQVVDWDIEHPLRAALQGALGRRWARWRSMR